MPIIGKLVLSVKTGNSARKYWKKAGAGLSGFGHLLGSNVKV